MFKDNHIMQIMPLLILPIILGSIPLAEGGLLSKCWDFFTKIGSSRKDGCPIDREDRSWLQGKKYDQLELLNVNGKEEKYPYCYSFRAVEFTLANHELPMVQVTFLKLHWKIAHGEIAAGDEETTAKVWYKMQVNRISFILDESLFPIEATVFGLDPLNKSSDPLSQLISTGRISEQLNLLLNIRNRMLHDLQFSMIYLADDKSYAIFQTKNQECTWIGWMSDEAQSKGLTEEIKSILTSIKVKYEQFRPQGQTSGSEVNVGIVGWN